MGHMILDPALDLSSVMAKLFEEDKQTGTAASVVLQGKWIAQIIEWYNLYW